MTLAGWQRLAVAARASRAAATLHRVWGGGLPAQSMRRRPSPPAPSREREAEIPRAQDRIGLDLRDGFQISAPNERA